MAVVSGVFSWVKIATPDLDPWDRETWQASVAPNAKEAKVLEKLGMKPRTDDDGTKMFTFKRRTKWASGDAQKQPRVIDNEGLPLDPGTVGNGSKGRLQYKVEQGTSARGTYKLFDLCAIAVDELVVYDNGGDGDELMGDTEAKVDEDPFV